MDFNPNDAETPVTPRLLPDGRYTLRVREAEERVSSKGNPMTVLEFEVSGQPGAKIIEYLVCTPAAMFKIRNFCEAGGLMDKFNAGRLEESDFRGVIVDAEVIIEDGQDGYSDKNRVREFHPPSSSTERALAGQAPASTTGPHQPVDESDIPF